MSGCNNSQGHWIPASWKLGTPRGRCSEKRRNKWYNVLEPHYKAMERILGEKSRPAVWSQLCVMQGKSHNLSGLLFQIIKGDGSTQSVALHLRIQCFQYWKLIQIKTTITTKTTHQHCIKKKKKRVHMPVQVQGHQSAIFCLWTNVFYHFSNVCRGCCD